MFNRVKKTNKTKKDDNKLTTNPITSRDLKELSNEILKKIKDFKSLKNPEIKHKEMSKIVDHINSLSELEILALLTNKEEIIRSIAVKAFVDKSPENLIIIIDKMLKHKNPNLRDSAVISLCYINSVEILELLYIATKDDLISIKLKALAGIADIAAEHSNEQAKTILKQFLADENQEIREFIKDELSILE